MDPEQARSIFEQAISAAREAGIHDVEVLTGERHHALTRFANNAIHQNVAETGRYISVRVLVDQRTARVTSNRLDRVGIQSTVEQAIALTRASAPNPDLLPMFAPSPIPEVSRWRPATANATAEHRGATVRDAIAIAKEMGQNAAGIYSTGASFEALLNSSGVEAFYDESLAQFSITSMAADSSGWAKASAGDCGAIDAVALARAACEKAARSANPKEAAPGKYVVVLEPAAVVDLVGQIFVDFSGTAIAEQRSFLSDRLGETLFGENIDIADDVQHPMQAGSPFDGEGVARRRIDLVSKGRAAHVVHSRVSAAKTGVEPTGHGYPLPNDIGEAPANIVIAGGPTPLEEMIRTTKRGILVTRLWYIREVEPYEKIMTGMTRDGTFLIENGEIAHGLRNFRFNQSVVELLRRVESLGPSARASGEESFDMVVPPMKVRDFQFTEVTRF